MNKIRELKIDSTLWATTENDKLITIITHQVKYENGGFYLTINNIKGYFSFIDNSATNVVLNMIFSNDNQKK